MAFISRVLVTNSSLFKFNKYGILSTYVTQKFTSATAYCEPLQSAQNSNKNNELRLLKRYTHFNPEPKHIKPYQAVGKLVKLQLPMIVSNANNLPAASLLATFHKLCIIYHTNKADPGFQREVENFTKTEAFQTFCKLLEKGLPKFSPPSLTVLVNLVHFGVSPESTIFKKVFTLILDNLHCLSVCDLLELYSELKEKFSDNIPLCKNIKEACEIYFETALEDELSHCHVLNDLVYFVSDRNLPLRVRKLITEKFLDKIESGRYLLSLYPKFFASAFKEPLLSLYKTQLLEKLKIVLNDYPSSRPQVVFSVLYRKGVHKCNSLYDKEICEKIISNISSFGISDGALIRTLENICLTGHFSQELLDKVSDLILSIDITNLEPKTALSIASIFARNSFHEMNSPNWSKIKHLLVSYDALTNFARTPNEMFQWYEYLTYLECDATDSLRFAFKKANEYDIFDSPAECRSLLRVHHSVKKCFPDSIVGLSKKALNSYLQKSVFKKNFYHSTCIPDLYGNEDYVVFNCLSSEFHFLPFIMVLGPNNKPINLSAYKPKNEDQFYYKNFKVVTNIDYIERPPGSKMIAFLEYPDSQPLTFNNAPIKSGFLRMFLNSYDSIANTVNIVLINKNFSSLRPEEKLDYLKSEVNKIIDKSESTVSEKVSN